MVRPTPFLCALPVVLLPTLAAATTWYVSGTGNDKHRGTSASQAFRHLQTAANVTQPGDTVLVLNGTYTPPCHGCDVLDIVISGTQEAPITYRAAAGQTPLVSVGLGWTGIHVDAAYIVIDGFAIQGNAAAITYQYAWAHRKNLSNYRTSANGIFIDSGINGTTPHHITVRNNMVYDNPGCGLCTAYADYITIQNNIAYGNANWSPYAGSGISIWEMRDTDGYTGYKNYILDNVSYNNQEYIPFYESGHITDGNGIIVDDNKNTQSNNVAYGGRTLVANNIVYDNGGSGIHGYDSAHVDIVGNTAYMNNQTPSINEGQIFSNAGTDVNILDNIAYAPAGDWFYSAYHNDSTVLYDYNVLFSTTIGAGLSGSPIGPHDIVADPLLANPASGNFNLATGSPAISSAIPGLLPSTDFAGNPRPSPGGGYDRGALQYSAP
jgi:parallel beta-helix repeat protein